jgi:hypothetical protein
MTETTDPSTDRGLAQTAARQSTTGWRLLLAGGVLFAIGLLLMLVGSDEVDYAGVAFAALSTPVTLAGLALVLSGMVGNRASQHKPFA